MASERIKQQKPEKAHTKEGASPTPVLQSEHSVLSMQRLQGNRRTVQQLRQIQRWPMDGMPDPEYLKLKERLRQEQERRKEEYSKAAATPLRTLSDLITLVKKVEAAYPSDDWKGITTRIRKSYYDGFLWNSMIDDRDSYPGLAWPPMAIEDYKAFTEAKKNPELVINKENVDIGHVFTGLDAMNFPDAGAMMDAYGIQGPHGATWSGDVGSALAVWDVETDGDANKREEYYKRYASDDDMLGDVDGLAIKLNPAGGDATMGGSKLSDRIRWYYSSTGGATMRFTNFCAAAGFKWTGRGSGIKLDSGSRATIRSQIISFGKAFRLKSGGIPTANWFYDADVDWFVERFVNWVVAGLARENP